MMSMVLSVGRKENGKSPFDCKKDKKWYAINVLIWTNKKGMVNYYGENNKFYDRS